MLDIFKNKYILIMTSILAWGSWGVLDKKALNNLSVLEMWLYKIIVDIVILPFIIYFILKKNNDMKLSLDKESIILCIISAIVCIIAELAFINLIKYNPVGWTVSITSVYPIVTVMLGIVILKESINIKQIIGSLIICFGLYLIN